MKKLNLSIEIAAPCKTVWRTVIEDASYRQWTQPFCEGSYFVGSWAPGESIRFLSPSGGGMVSVIAEHRPQALISIKHLGYIHNGVEDTDSEAVRRWAPAFENYIFVATASGTMLHIEQDMSEEHEQFMRDAWPKALAVLKALCEG